MSTLASIEVNKQSIKDFLKEGTKAPFVIPVYQRPYTWDEDDEIETLFADLANFVNDNTGDDEITYFLGCVVSYRNSAGEQEIIDGQQRITTLFLLLRAIYKMIENEEGEKADNYRKQIAPALWHVDKDTGRPFFDQVLLNSHVISDTENQVLREILRTGEADTKAKDHYSRNYLRFQELLADFAKHHPLSFYDLVYKLLNQAILLPITAGNQETALTIFDTLNNRGKPLSDADIFKAKIYEHLTEKPEKDAFIEQWKNLEDDLKNIGDENIQKLFTYYMFYLRARDNDVSTTTPGVRKYYAQNDYTRLYARNLMTNLNKLLNIFRVIYNHESIKGEPWSESFSIQKSLDILRMYPNEFWKYPVIIYYLEYNERESFTELFDNFLHKLICEIMTRFVCVASLNFVKGDILKLNAAIVSSEKPEFIFKPYEEQELSDRLKNPNLKITRMLLAAVAYSNENQKQLLPTKWEIEHIYPQKWDSKHFENLPEAEVKKKVESLGNKVPLEKRLNIQASNGFFSKKQDFYKQSKIALCNDLVEHHGDWQTDDIDERCVRVLDTIRDMVDSWRKTYAAQQSSKGDGETRKPEISAEEQAMLDHLRSRNLI